ncbi:MAG: Heparinase II/III-like protein [bacterium ADurb.Bin429]|nr:MAG: Heparinase II/III-like protein [bacterium ADurb.Bin429]
MRYVVLALMACVLLPAGAAVTKSFSITEPFGLAWGPDRVSYVVEFPQGQVTPNGVALKDTAGQPVAVQLSDITYWDAKKKSVKSATVSFMATLAPHAKGTWTLTAGTKAVKQPKTDLEAAHAKASIVLTTAKTGIRLPVGAMTYAQPMAADGVPPPIQGIRLSDGRWIGKGWWETERPCLGYSATLTDAGPVFARVALSYTFADNTFYTATVELNAGQDLAVISEEFNLSDGKRYAMPEQGGAKPGDTFAYVKPHFVSKTDEMMWDWWCPSSGLVPSPNCYRFAFYQGFQPDSAEIAGRTPHEYMKPGDGGLNYGKDGRVISLNAWSQWVGDESFYFGAYNAKGGADELAIVALRPGEWLHPDLDPHPNKTLKQYVQTNNLWIDRATKPDLILRAPTMLGKRVYGIGVLQRKPVTTTTDTNLPVSFGDAPTGVVPALDKDNTPKVKTGTGTEIMLRHIRLGRLELNTVKDWVVDYPETSKYPRLFVDAGDLERMRKRAKQNLADQQHLRWVRWLNDGKPATGQQLINESLAFLTNFCQTFALTDYGHMMYAINTGTIAHQVDIALAVPEITPEQRAQFLRLSALNLYNSLADNYVPPRRAGFAWGSANMQAQLRARGALLAALLPNHPDGNAWRQYLAGWVTAYTESQVNEAGATLECPHYGGMAVELGVVPLLALSHCGDIDTSAAIARYKAAARHRLGTLLPWDLRGNMRSVPPVGDGYYDSDGTFIMMAALLEKADPALAKQLVWGIRESGGSMGGHPTLIGALIDPGLEPQTPVFGSENYPGDGFVMRNGFPRRDETYLYVTAGSFSVGHGHPDRGAFILYSKGAPLMVDFAAMYTPSFRETWHHAGGLTFGTDERVKPCPGKDHKDCYYTGKIWEPHSIEPFTSVEPGWDPTAKDLDEAFGTVQGFVSTPRADYAEMHRRISYLNRVPYMMPATHGKLITYASGSSGDDVWAKHPFTWTRRYALVKSPDPLGHNYLVFRDDLRGNQEFTPALNLWAMADKLEVNGQSGRYTGTFGVDLDCYVAEPRTFAHRTHTISHNNQFGFSSYFKKTFGQTKPFESQILFQIPQAPGKGGYFVALVPRKPEEPQPTFATVLDGNGIRVTFPDRTDTVVLLNAPGTVTLDGLILQGTAFVVTQEVVKTTVTLLAPGSVKRGETVLLQSETAKSIEVK